MSGEVRLHSTLTKRKEPLVAGRRRRGRDLRLRADGVRAHPHRQRPALRRLLGAQALPGAARHEGQARVEPDGRQRQDLRRRPGGGDAERRARPALLGRLHRRHRPPRPGPARRRAPRDRDDPGDHRADRDPRRARPGLPARRRRLLPRRGASRATGACRGAAWTRWSRASPAPARSRPSTSRSGRGASPTRTPGGSRPGARAAPAGTSSARRWPRAPWARASRCTAGASTWSSPTTRTRSPSPRARTAGCMAHIWMHNEMLELGDEKMSKSIGNIAPAVGRARPLARRGGDRLLPHQPLPLAAAVLGGAPGGRRAPSSSGSPTPCARSTAAIAGRPRGPRPGPVAHDRGGPRRVLPGPRRRLRHPRGLRGALRDGARRQPGDRRRARPAPASCARRAASWPSCWTPSASARIDPGPPAEVPDEVLALVRRREEARAARDFAGADALRDRVRALGYEITDTAEGPRVDAA